MCGHVHACKTVDCLETKGSLNDNHHGFKIEGSCAFQVLTYRQALINILENRETADVVYLDFVNFLTR